MVLTPRSSCHSISRMESERRTASTPSAVERARSAVMETATAVAHEVRAVVTSMGSPPSPDLGPPPAAATSVEVAGQQAAAGVHAIHSPGGELQHGDEASSSQHAASCENAQFQQQPYNRLAAMASVAHSTSPS